MTRFFLILACALICTVALGQNHPQSQKNKNGESSLVERVELTGFIQLEADSFKTLTPKQKELAYWLSQAAIAIHPIIFDQSSRFGLKQKHILEQIVAHPNGVKPEVMEKILDYTKLFWGNRGNHNEITAQKFLPSFTFEELEAAGTQAIRNGADLGTPAQ